MRLPFTPFARCALCQKLAPESRMRDGVCERPHPMIDRYRMIVEGLSYQDSSST